ncbi:TetR/AcrR family transcriptional regulator [uncultured Eubacterium sp.]|uniref:TetR/AcrR family transcriptional regulator n=1 Tax=uncultured Eubacterium sp. TaxID=165185 RepID=UPI00258CFF84|nr:TetR/AcrR family transcriptional regulator [uncultured Eubacterium sp.]
MQQFTKKEIKLSTLRLLQSKPLDNIKVKDIIDDIGISRNTFYYHYHDIYDVLKDIFDETMLEITKNSDENFDWEAVFKKMSENALAKKSIITNIFKSKYSDNIKNYIANAVGDTICSKIKAKYDAEGKKIDDYDLKIISTFYKHALTGTFFEWVHNGMRVPPKEFFEKLSNVTRKV